MARFALRESPGAGAFSSQVETLGGSENATKQKIYSVFAQRM
jgi:hypothetical protein